MMLEVGRIERLAGLGVVYLDGGFDACRDTLRGLFSERIAALRRSSKDAKTRLQEWLQGRGLALPHYELIDSHGEDHAKTFDVSCAIVEPVPVSAEACGISRRAAEQDAAEIVLNQLLEQQRKP